MTAPRLLLLAGLSCSGKTSLGRALQRSLRPDIWLLWESDRFYDGLRLGDSEEVKALIAHKRKHLRGELAAIASYLQSGVKMIAEIHVWDDERLTLASEVLQPFVPLVIELRCALSTLEQREKERGRTYVGFARQQAEGREWNVPADLVVDSESSNADQLCEAVIQWLREEPTPRGLARNEFGDR